MEDFHLSPEYFPDSTREFLSPEVMLRLGAIPLGFKMTRRFFRPCRRLNLGLVDVRRESIRAVKSALHEKIKGGGFERIRIYQVAPGEFLEVIRGIFGISPEQLRSFSAESLSPVLNRFLAVGG